MALELFVVSARTNKRHHHVEVRNLHGRHRRRPRAGVGPRSTKDRGWKANTACIPQQVFAELETFK
jgi:hypothetical protein